MRSQSAEPLFLQKMTKRPGDEIPGHGVRLPHSEMAGHVKPQGKTYS